MPSSLYIDIRMALTEILLLSSLLWTLEKILFPGVFSKNIYLNVLGFQRLYKKSFLFIVKPEVLRMESLKNDIACQKQ